MKKTFPTTPSGKYLVEFRKGRDPARPNARSRSFSTEKEAREYWESLPDRRRKKAADGYTFAELADKYIIAKTAGMSATDADNTYTKLNSIILPKLGHLLADNLKHEQLDKYVTARMQDCVHVYMGKNKPKKKTDKKVSLSTIGRELDIIRAILNWSVERQLIVSSPMAGYKKPPSRGKVILPPTEEDFQAILKHASPHCKRLILVSYYTGLRPGKVEAYGLKWEHVDLKNKTIQIVSAEKGGVPLRIVPLHPKLYKALRWWKRCDERAGYKNGYIIHYNYRPITTSMKTAWKGAKKRAGITRSLRPYSLRHKTATDLLKHTQGDVKTAAEVLGNDPKTLMEYYQSVDTEQKRRAVEGLK